MPDLRWRMEYVDEIFDPKGLCEFALTSGNVEDLIVHTKIVRPCYYDHDATISFSILKDTFTLRGHLVADPDHTFLGPTYVVTKFDRAPVGFTWYKGFEPGPTDNPN